MSLHIEVVDVHDESVFAPWYAAYAAALEAAVGADEAQVYGIDELRVQWQEQTSDVARTGYVGRLDGPDGEVVAVGAMGLFQLENLDGAYVEVAVAPAHQGHGHGRAMLAHVEAAALAAGRTRLTSEVRFPYSHGTSGLEGEGSRDVRFALAAGFSLGLSDVQRWLDAPVDPALLDRLAAEAAPHHTAYEVHSWVGPVPDRWAASWAELDGSLMTEAPMGDLEHEAVKADVARLREMEDNVAKQDRVTYHSIAVASDDPDRVVAYSMLVEGRTSTTAYQWGTLVHRDHRGRRLGMAVKIANQRLLQAERPDCTRVSTWNAEVNGHMISVNEEMGFRAVSRMGEFQKKV